MTGHIPNKALLPVASVVLLAAALLILGVLAGRSGPETSRPAREGPAEAPAMASRGEVSRAPADDSMRLTVPAMKRVRAVPVETAPATDKAPLRNGALHVEGTGFPWQEGANVYVAGHRLGFPGTRSHLLFDDLGRLEKGDRVVLEDSEGREYEYAVFRKMVVGPDAVRVTDPVPGESVVSLQTCTLPDYAERLVVQARLREAAPAALTLPGAKEEEEAAAAHSPHAKER